MAVFWLVLCMEKKNTYKSMAYKRNIPWSLGIVVSLEKSIEPPHVIGRPWRLQNECFRLISIPYKSTKEWNHSMDLILLGRDITNKVPCH